MKIEALRPLHIRRAAGDLHLRPGVPIDFPDDEAVKLLEKASGKVRAVPDAEVLVEPATKPDGSPLRPVYWERADGSIQGPATPEFFAKVGAGQEDRNFWIIAAHHGEPVWIRSDKLRSKRQFETQTPVREIEPVSSWMGKP